MRALSLTPTRLRYRGLIGTGGIGSGMFFALHGNHTLGREESRSGHILDRQDYCKLHIVAHYVATLLGPIFPVLPIGKVGDDDPGRRMLQEMTAAGLDLRHVGIEAGRNTLFSICFLYPDGSGGNLTTADSASAQVDAAWVSRAEPDLAALGAGSSSPGMALCMPEVSMGARARLLDLATRYGLYRAASFTSEEVAEARDSGLLAQVDLLAANRDEGAALAGITAEWPAQDIVEAAVASARAANPSIMLSITAGREGSWTWDGQLLRHVPAHHVPVAGTAGAGDGHMAGNLVGLAVGLALSEAQELGTLVAAMSVTSPHTINKAIDGPALAAFAATLPTRPCAAVCSILGI
jgi:ribokinase